MFLVASTYFVYQAEGRCPVLPDLPGADFLSLYILYQEPRYNENMTMKNPMHGNRRTGGRTGCKSEVRYALVPSIYIYIYIYIYMKKSQRVLVLPS
jgi:hypothetical protein